jgi:hypothetical protein
VRSPVTQHASSRRRRLNPKPQRAWAFKSKVAKTAARMLSASRAPNTKATARARGPPRWTLSIAPKLRPARGGTGAAHAAPRDRRLYLTVQVAAWPSSPGDHWTEAIEAPEASSKETQPVTVWPGETLNSPESKFVPAVTESNEDW